MDSTCKPLISKAAAGAVVSAEFHGSWSHSLGDQEFWGWSALLQPHGVGLGFPGRCALYLRAKTDAGGPTGLFGQP